MSELCVDLHVAILPSFFWKGKSTQRAKIRERDVFCRKQAAFNPGLTRVYTLKSMSD